MDKGEEKGMIDRLKLAEALRFKFIKNAVAQIVGKDTITRDEIACDDTTFEQLERLGVIRGEIIRGELSIRGELRDYTGMRYWRVEITTADFSAAEALANEKPLSGEEKIKRFLEGITVTEADELEFKEILRDHDGLKYFYPAIAPKLAEMDLQKQAILIALASHWDECDDRYRVHVLMYGKESTGTGKTPLLLWLRKLGAGYVSMRATKAGITVDLRDGSPGFLPKRHRGVCSIDELDKMEKQDRDGILQSMEEGIVSYAAAGIEGEHPAEAIIIAGANIIKVFTQEQFMRFDFRFEMKEYTVEQACNIADEISWGMGRQLRSNDELKLMRFLVWIRGRNAAISDEIREKGAEIIKDYIKRTRITDIRRIMSIWRVARSIARLSYRDVIEDDMNRAVRMLNGMDAGNLKGKLTIESKG